MALLLTYARQCVAQESKPFRIVDLKKIATPVEHCAVKWRTLFDRVLWIDESRLAIGVSNYCNDHQQKGPKVSTEVVVIRADGSTQIGTDENIKPLDRSELSVLSLGRGGGAFINGRAEWKVTESDSWYFDPHGILTSLKSGAPVTQERWTPEGCYCTGELSVSKPRRFLATCIGTHFYTDGDLDSIFGYSRIALFDVDSRRMVWHINGPPYISTALSPSGKQIAIEHLGEVSLYRVD